MRPHPYICETIAVLQSLEIYTSVSQALKQWVINFMILFTDPFSEGMSRQRMLQFKTQHDYDSFTGSKNLVITSRS
jgi:hypothetical protein